MSQPGKRVNVTTRPRTQRVAHKTVMMTDIIFSVWGRCRGGGEEKGRRLAPKKRRGSRWTPKGRKGIISEIQEVAKEKKSHHPRPVVIRIVGPGMRGLWIRRQLGKTTMGGKVPRRTRAPGSDTEGRLLRGWGERVRGGEATGNVAVSPTRHSRRGDPPILVRRPPAFKTSEKNPCHMGKASRPPGAAAHTARYQRPAGREAVKVGKGVEKKVGRLPSEMPADLHRSADVHSRNQKNRLNGKKKNWRETRRQTTFWKAKKLSLVSRVPTLG